MKGFTINNKGGGNVNLYHKVVQWFFYTTPELKEEYALAVETKVVRIHGLWNSMNIRQGYKDIELLYPEDSARQKKAFTFAIIKFCVFSVLLIGSALWYRISRGISIQTINFNMDLTRLPFEIILIALITIVFNILDSLTTNLCFKQYPDKELKGEGNPLMRKLMLKNYKLAEAVKHMGVLMLVMFCLVANYIDSLKLLAILLGLVVLNNTYILLSRAMDNPNIITITTT